jgi:hypothetical protein
VVHGRFDAQLTRPFACLYVGRKHHLQYLLPHEEVMRQYGPMTVHHSPMPTVLARAIGDYGYILRDPDEQRLVTAALAIQEKAPVEPAVAIGLPEGATVTAVRR